MRSNSIPAPVLTTTVLRHHTLPPFVQFLFSSSAANLLPFTSLLLQDKSLLVGMKRDDHCSLNKGASFSKLQPGVAEFGLTDSCCVVSEAWRFFLGVQGLIMF
ncbi:hypothetical protein ILYODFUR_000192 [Ilyodon furcidens]|uniref:Uncharacterized protein n=1 Tax=Ilyodon furcidens TaxID=33524 RepID=A0ABV0U5Q8_9TELE